jgi:hypothetical protein
MMISPKKIIICILIIGGVLPVDQGFTTQEQNHIEDVKLPACWQVQKIIPIPQDRLKGFSKRLGSELVSTKNYIFDIKGIMLRVNIAERGWCSIDPSTPS